MGIFFAGGSSEDLLVKCSFKNIENPLNFMTKLQEIFIINFHELESSQLNTNDNNLFCISTKDGLFELTVKNGSITFFDANEKVLQLNHSGSSLEEVFKNFGKALIFCSYCEIIAIKKNSGISQKLTFVIKNTNKGILRTYFQVENYND